MDLKDKVAIITGSSSGIGESIARHLNKAGVKVVLTGRSLEKLEKIAADLKDVAIVAGEITDPAIPPKLIETALESFGQLDIFINNAGMMRIGSIDDVDIEELCEMARTNFESVLRCSYHALRHFKKQNSGYLINMSSIAGTRTFPAIGAYNGTKFAVEALTDSLRMEVGETGINVAVVEPGTVETPLYDTWTAEQRKVVGEGLHADDIAKTVQYILEQPEKINIARVLVLPSNQVGGG